ncbi:Dynamin family [Aspergillus sclerotialis]|uniref:Dynamin family n=1 Tax=Aspergillus sclerotialis TaxID=2070753 RepID=A0A3A2ZWQ5_9EURO|nr:Dynamin family [Aspergillus sclerotialis]
MSYIYRQDVLYTALTLSDTGIGAQSADCFTWEEIRDINADSYRVGLPDRQAQEINNIEYTKPFTLTKDALNIATHDANDHLKEKRFKARGIKYLYLQGKYAEDDPRRWAEINELTEAQLGKDKFVEELKMAKTRAYHGIATIHFIDPICQSTHTMGHSHLRVIVWW